MDRHHKDNRHDPISVFDLEALREAFRQALRDNGAEAAEWSEQAASFLKSVGQNRSSSA